jgi:heme/copper-type cytochrome/quinol oxidase subunit 2
VPNVLFSSEERLPVIVTLNGTTEIQRWNMANKIAWCAILAGVISMLSIALPAQASCTIYVTAANWQFSPDHIAVAVGKPVTLRLTSAGGVHGIQSSALGISQTVIAPGKTVDVTFTPMKTGTYRIPCSVFCGAGHSNMALTIEVK